MNYDAKCLRKKKNICNLFALPFFELAIHLGKIYLFVENELIHTSCIQLTSFFPDILVRIDRTLRVQNLTFRHSKKAEFSTINSPTTHWPFDIKKGRQLGCNFLLFVSALIIFLFFLFILTSHIFPLHSLDTWKQFSLIEHLNGRICNTSQRKNFYTTCSVWH